MGFTEATSTCLKKSVDWSGRASRSEFWWFELAQLIFIVIAAIIDQIVGTQIFYILAIIALILPSIAVFIRRLHDTDRTGWWFWIQLLPLIGLIVILVFMLTGSDAGDNKYGPNPQGSAAGPPTAA